MTKIVKENGKISETEARKVLIESDKKSQDLFLKEYDELCKKHGLRLAPTLNLNIQKV